MTEGIWVAIIGFFKDIFVALIGKHKKKHSKPSIMTIEHYDQSEQETHSNPFIPSDKDIEKISIDDEDYFLILATYVGSDRSLDDISINNQ